MQSRQIVVWAAILLVLPSAVSAGYVVTDLGALGMSQGYSVNNSGQVAGFTFTGLFTSRAVVYSGGTVTDLGTLGGPGNVAIGINNSGQVVGYSGDVLTGEMRAFIYAGGVMTDLGDFGGTLNQAYAINDAGEVTGLASTTSGEQHAFRYSGGSMTDLGQLGSGFSAGTSINSHGGVAGYSFNGLGQKHAFVHSGGSMQDLGFELATSFTILEVSLNDSGVVVGTYRNASLEDRAFAYDNGVFSDLGTLGGSSSHACSINNVGEIVGRSAIDGIGTPNAFIFKNGVMMNLNDQLVGTGWVLSDAFDISDNGHIVGYGSYFGGSSVAVLLTPDISEVPEPSTLALLGTGLMGLVGYRRRNALNARLK